MVLSALTGQSVTPEVDAAASALTIAKLRAARDAMPTTLAQDIKQLRMCAYKGEGGSVVPRLRLHIAEKRLLKNCIEREEERAAWLDERAAKRLATPPAVDSAAAKAAAELAATHIDVADP